MARDRWSAGSSPNTIARDGGDDEGDAEHVEIDADFVTAWKNRGAEHQTEDAWRFDGCQLLHQRDATRAKQRAEHTAGAGEHHALREHLSHDAAAARADSEPHGHLALPGRAAREQEIRDIRAHDHEDDDDARKQHTKGGPQAPDGLILEALHLESRHRKGRRVSGPGRANRRAHRVHFLDSGIQ